MEGGYINEGGQLKSKNGQRYVVNQPAQGIILSRACFYVACIIFGALMLISGALVILLLTQSTCSSQDGHNGHIPNETIVAGSFSGIPNGQGTKISTNGHPTKKTIKLKPTIVTDSHHKDDDDEDESDYSDDEYVENNDDAIVLSEGWNPVNYKLTIEPNFDTSLNNGTVIISITRDGGMSSLEPIILDINNIEILRTVVTGAEDVPLPFESFYGKNNQTFNIVLKDQGDDIRNVTVQLDFESKLTDTLQGFYKGSYKVENSDEPSWFASTQFSPIDARRAFPCFDRPDKKATFDIVIVRSHDMKMFLSNMKHKGSSTARPGFIQEHFYTTPKMSTYLVAFIISNLKQAQQSSDGFEPQVNIWARPEVENMTSYAHKLTLRILPFLENYFKIKFNLKKIDIVAVPDFGFSAMENWGLITFRESALLVPEDNNKSSSAKHTERVASVIAHELAHQWFGNLVTPKWWDDLWLKEGFATYMSYECLHFAEPNWRIFETFTLNELQKAMEKDSDQSSHPISFPVDKPADIRRIFDPISYSKGASIIRMMSSFLGRTIFKNGINDYLKTFQYANAVQDDLWEILSRHGHKANTLPAEMDIKEIMDTWTLQAGFPVVLLERNDTTLVISQQRYMLPEKDISDESKWFIPITIVTQRSPVMSQIPEFWLNNENKSITITTTAASDEWIYLNSDRSGYYRVNYDLSSWKKLTTNFPKLPSVTRAQLIDDALQLARAEFIQYDIPLTFVLILAQYPRDITAWAAMNKGLEYVTNMMTREPAYESYLAVMRTILRNAFNTLGGFDELPHEDHVQVMHRARIVRMACRFNIDKCTNSAQLLYRKWMTNPNENRIPPNLKEIIYCTSLREGGVPEWNFAYKRYLETTSASEKELILNALGCSSKPWLLTKYLNMTLLESSGIRKQDGARAFSAVAKNSIGYEIAFDFLYTNIEQISEYFGDGFSTLSKMIDSVTTFMNKNYHKEQFDRFAKKSRKLGLTSIEKSIHLAEEQIDNNIFWKSRSYYKLQEFLKQLIKDMQINIY